MESWRNRKTLILSRTDMMGLVGPSILDSYARLPEFAAALRAAGFSPAETGRILGGNYARVFQQSLA